MVGFFKRCGQCVLPMLMSADIFLCSVWLSLLYPWKLARRPTGREMVSTYVGEALHNGMPWAARAAAVIDYVALRLGGGPQHCLRNYLRYAQHDDYDYPVGAPAGIDG